MQNPPQTFARPSVTPPQRGSGGTAQPLPTLARVPWEISVILTKLAKRGHFFGGDVVGACVCVCVARKGPHLASFVKKHLFPKEPVRALEGAEQCPRSLSEVG